MKDELIQKLLEYLQRSEDFLLEQAPEVLQQALRYQIVSNWCGALLTGLGTMLLVGIAYYVWRHPTLESWGGRDFLSSFGVFPPLLGAIPLGVICIAAVDNLIKLYIAPKYYLVQMLMSWKS